MVEIKQWFNWYRSKGPRYTGSTLIWKLLTVPKLTQCYLLLIINYHAISIERLPSKTKIGNFSWYFNNSLLCKPDFSSATKNLLSLLKTQKVTTHQQVTGGNTLSLVLKRMVGHFLQIQPIKEILEF